MDGQPVNGMLKYYLNVHKFSDTLNLVILYNDEISAYKIGDFILI